MHLFHDQWLHFVLFAAEINELYSNGIDGHIYPSLFRSVQNTAGLEALLMGTTLYLQIVYV